MGKEKCRICNEEIESDPYSGKVYITQEGYTTNSFPTMYFHVNCYLLKHYFKNKEAI